jgi:phage shock protein A
MFFVNLYNKLEKIMSSLADIEVVVDAVRTTVGAIDLKLDDVRALVTALKAGQVSQAQIDALKTKVDELKTATTAVATETDTIG